MSPSSWRANLRGLGSAGTTPDGPAAGVRPRRWVEVPSTWRYRSVRELIARDVIQALARSGGWIPARSPGWLVLWRGWTRLHTVLELDPTTPTM